MRVAEYAEHVYGQWRYIIEEDDYTHTGIGRTKAEAKKNAERLAKSAREKREEE